MLLEGPQSGYEEGGTARRDVFYRNHTSTTYKHTSITTRHKKARYKEVSTEQNKNG